MTDHLSDALAYAAILQRRQLAYEGNKMGCDIHFVVEGKVASLTGDRWVGVYSTSHTPNMAHSPDDMYYRRGVWCDARDYAFFAQLAGVRGEGPEPNGLPDDMSELAQILVDGYGSDGHSHGHMPLLEFVRAKMRANEGAVTAAEVTRRLTKTQEELDGWPYNKAESKAPEYLLADLSAYSDEASDTRVVFFFDN